MEQLTYIMSLNVGTIKNPAGEDVYKEIIENTKQESIDIGDDEKIEELIKILPK